MRKLLYFLLKPYFEKMQADIDYCLMISGDENFPKVKNTKGGK